MKKETIFMDTVFSSALELLRLYNSQQSESLLKHEVRRIKNNLAWVVDPEMHLKQQIPEIRPREPFTNFTDLIASYAFCIQNFLEEMDWGWVNQIIIDRWGAKQLEVIKIQAGIAVDEEIRRRWNREVVIGEKE